MALFIVIVGGTYEGGKKKEADAEKEGDGISKTKGQTNFGGFALEH